MQDATLICQACQDPRASSKFGGRTAANGPWWRARLGDGQSEARLKSSQVPAHSRRVKSGEQGTRGKGPVWLVTVPASAVPARVDCVRVAVLWLPFQTAQGTAQGSQRQITSHAEHRLDESRPHTHTHTHTRDPQPARAAACSTLTDTAALNPMTRAWLLFVESFGALRPGLAHSRKTLPFGRAGRGICVGVSAGSKACKGSNPHGGMTEPGDPQPYDGKQGCRSLRPVCGQSCQTGPRCPPQWPRFSPGRLN